MRSAGDVRANENSVLYGLQTLFVREHNRKCEELVTKFPKSKGDDEWLYQYARRWVIALMQHITYDEWLPSLLGDDLEQSRGYDKRVNTQCTEAFVRAAFRYGHSAVPTVVHRAPHDPYAPWYEHIALLMRDAFFVPETTEKSGLAAVLLGAAKQRMSAVDALMVDDVRNKLFRVAIDLAAINLERERDTRCPRLNDVREAFGLKRHRSMKDIACGDTYLEETLESLYRGDPDEVDLFTGGLCEFKANDKSALGETFHRVIKDQFKRTRDGDRFWYEWSMEDWEVAQVKAETLVSIIGKNSHAKWAPTVSGWPTVKSGSFFVPESKKCKSIFATKGTGTSSNCHHRLDNCTTTNTILVVFIWVFIVTGIVSCTVWVGNFVFYW